MRKMLFFFFSLTRVGIFFKVFKYSSVLTGYETLLRLQSVTAHFHLNWKEAGRCSPAVDVVDRFGRSLSSLM